jgi:hypothetical protein
MSPLQRSGPKVKEEASAAQVEFEHKKSAAKKIENLRIGILSIATEQDASRQRRSK